MDPIGTVRKRHNAVCTKVHGGWTVVWTLFTDDTSRQGYFYPDRGGGAGYIAGGELVAHPSRDEIAFAATT